MIFPEISLWIILTAIILDSLIGDPDWIWRRLPHPVVWFGAVISMCEKAWNRPVTQSRVSGRAHGVVTIVIVIGVAFTSGYFIQHLLVPLGWIGGLLVVAIGSIFIAQRSLHDHVKRVAEPLSIGDLSAARRAVSMIVGRNPDHLDEAGVSRAAIETTAENFSDGVVAPIFWFSLLGLPGLLAYKALNTADSMIGHRNDRYEHFGWASARLDDLANWIPARLTMLLILLAPVKNAAGSRDKAWKIVANDATKHRSPNAGWPEAAMAGRLDVALSGPRIYEDRKTDEPFVNQDGQKDIGAVELDLALGLYKNSCILMACMIGFLAIAEHYFL